MTTVKSVTVRTNTKRKLTKKEAEIIGKESVEAVKRIEKKLSKKTKV